MVNICRIFTLLLTLTIAVPALAGDAQDKQTKKTEKIKEFMNSVGINNPRILALTSTVSDRMEGRYVRLAEEHFEMGRVVLHYKATPKISTRQMELKFQPYNSNTEFVATTRSAMVNYKYKF